MRQVEVSQSRSKGAGGGAVHSLVLMWAEQTGVCLIHLCMVPGAFGPREHCLSMPGKDAEDAREMAGCI